MAILEEANIAFELNSGLFTTLKAPTRPKEVDAPAAELTKEEGKVVYSADAEPTKAPEEATAAQEAQVEQLEADASQAHEVDEAPVEEAPVEPASEESPAADATPAAPAAGAADMPRNDKGVPLPGAARRNAK